MTLTAVLGVYRLGTWHQYVRSFMPDTSHESLELLTQCLRLGFGPSLDPGQAQLSLLISIEFPSIPSLTTALPFPNPGIGALLHPELVVDV